MGSIAPLFAEGWSACLRSLRTSKVGACFRDTHHYSKGSGKKTGTVQCYILQTAQVGVLVLLIFTCYKSEYESCLEGIKF
jgi:hypothetical protein